ncbi:hypothetical protein NIES2119_11590 [[Phormidium ambiguum] IAM M-71]|uniref:Filamentous haemagglutinin FhaB/tRNA nuclease CdiA-like TPS domain-containing protein n=1 Tax=[Phormidium ambiguum] IAM M-71 TaxID=454136 RepID=A0A1U7IKV8_9CYAN|nr:filamentous hemagglutinin N-terminal domain-containing protein [Phormidium ambiguum]OKH37800.1 hypothetical protein NIES2119_11590 [Phormidium ambiguum IAM M-71]
MKPNYTDLSYNKNYLLLITILSLSELTNQQKSSKIERKKILLICQFFLLTFLCNLNQVQAQIIPDATVNSTVINNGTTNTIEGGTRAGNNLFHSFREFSVTTGGEAFFNNAVDIRNIFSRVTGSSISNIDGLIRANGTANLFLLNPNGIIFGPNARLNIGGSFFASTANSIKFTDGLEFAANNPQSPALLSINVPIGLQYGKTPREIRIQGNSSSSLKVLPGKALTILGGNVTIDGGILEALGGRIELGGVSTEGTIGLNNDGSLSFPENVARADVSIINQAEVRVLNSGGGSITVKARNLNISGESLLSAGIATGKGTPESIAGDIFLDATDAITIASSQIENIVEENAIGNSSTIKVNAKSLSLTNGSQLDASTLGKGKAGDIEIVIGDRLLLDGENNGYPSGILATVQQKAEGEAGNINITTNSLSITNGSQIGAATFGFGKAGEILIQANSVSLDGEGSESFSSIISGVEEGGIGDGRGITINTQTLTLTNGAQINATTLGKGNAGRITINATESVSFDGEARDGTSTGAFGIVGENAEGEADGIEINSRSLTLTNGAQINASTFSKGKAGRITINATEIVSFDGETKKGFSTGAFGIVDENAEGEADGIEINSRSLTLTNGAQINASTFGKGKAGRITINTSEIVSFDGETKNGNSTGAFGIVGDKAEGEANNIEITTKYLILTNGTQINASTFGKGKAGRIIINASESISFDGEGKKGFSTGAFGIVGENALGAADGIEINTRALTLTNGAQINANTLGKGNAGRIAINASESIYFDGEAKNEGSTGAFGFVGYKAIGAADGIEINTRSLILTNGAQINASTFGFGKAGRITINASEIVFFDGITRKGFSTGAFGSVGEEAVGAADGIEINTRSLILTNGAQLGVSTLGIGKAGRITINASESVSFDGEVRNESPSGAFGFVDESAQGEADGIEINTRSLTLTNGARIDASTLGIGKAGIINIASDTISLDGKSKAGFPTEVRSEVGENGIGEAGGINITANSLFVTNGAQLNASTSGKGRAGEVRITASDRISFDGINSGAFSIVEKGATGKAGGVTLETRLLTINNGAELSAGTFGEGNAGSVTINTNELLLNNASLVSTKVGKESKGDSGNINVIAGRLRLNNQSYLTAASEKGEGGNITIQSRDIQLRRQSEISAASALDAKEGNIDIATRTLALLEASEIRTDADAPKGGSNITILPIDDFGVAVFVSADSVISASGNLSIEGYIETQSSDIPQVEVIDATKLVVSTCRSREGEESQFIITGKGGLPSSPNESLKNDALWIDLRPINLKAGKAVSEEQRSRIQENSEHEIVEAQGWVKNAKGEVVLVTQTTKAIPQNSNFYRQNCVE